MRAILIDLRCEVALKLVCFKVNIGLINIFPGVLARLDA